MKNHDSFIVASVQMCSSHDINENLKTAEAFIKSASEFNADLIVFPEMFSIFGMTSFDKVKNAEKFGVGKVQSFLSMQSKKYKKWVISGTIPIESNNDGKIKSSCFVFDEKGECVSRYDKIHLFDVSLTESEQYNESETTDPGSELVVVDSPFGKIGLAVCYDLRFPELFRCLFNMGAEIIIIPSAFTVSTGEAHWEVLMRARAIENFCYVIGSCQGGVHSNGRKTYGHSIIIDPWGRILCEKKDDAPGIIYSEISLKPVSKAREKIPIRNHQKIFFDLEKLNGGIIE